MYEFPSNLVVVIKVRIIVSVISAKSFTLGINSVDVASDNTKYKFNDQESG